MLFLESDDFLQSPFSQNNLMHFFWHFHGTLLAWSISNLISVWAVFDKIIYTSMERNLDFTKYCTNEFCITSNSDNMTDIIKHLQHSVFIIQLSKFPLWMKKDTIYSYSFMCCKWKHTIKEQFNFVVDMLLVVRLPFLKFFFLWQNAIFSVILFIVVG